MEWIKTSERLPDFNGEVIAFIDGQVRGVLFNNDTKKFFRYCDNLKNVTHWMMLPEPPK